MLRHRKKRSDKLPGNNDFISKCKYFDLDISSNGKLDIRWGGQLPEIIGLP
jgi:hypothetical protein